MDCEQLRECYGCGHVWAPATVRTVFPECPEYSEAD